MEYYNWAKPQLMWAKYYNWYMQQAKDNPFLCCCGCTNQLAALYYLIRWKLTGRNPPWAGD